MRIRFAIAILVSLTALCATSVFADNALKVTGVSGASNHDLSAAATGVPIVYGGITGEVPGDCVSGELCNNCVAGTETSCNTVRIVPSLRLQITFTVTADITGPISFGFRGTSGTTSFTDIERSTTEDLKKGSTASVSVPWGEVCEQFLDASDSTCSAVSGGVNKTGTIVISLDPAFTDTTKTNSITVNILDPASFGGDNSLLACATAGAVPTSPDDGICRFVAHPGDQKVYLDFDVTVPNCSAGNAAFRAARFFYADISKGQTIAEASYGSSNFKDMPFDATCSPDGDWILDGLINDHLYLFRASMVDKANNNVFLNDPDDLVSAQPACDSTTLADGSSIDPTSGAFAADRECEFAATPGKVVGLLPEDFNCFVATAAYGTGFAKDIFILRKFRNEILLKSSMGRAFVNAYYKLGPVAAKFIADKPILRALTRTALWPAWGFAWLTMYYGFWATSLIALVLAGFFIVGFQQIRKPKVSAS